MKLDRTSNVDNLEWDMFLSNLWMLQSSVMIYMIFW